MGTGATELLSSPYLSIVGAAIPSIASAYWIWWQARIKRNESQDDRVDRRSAVLDNLQASFSTEQIKWVGELRLENKELRAELIETRRDRDRGWDYARYWHGKAHELFRLFRNLRHDALNMMQWIQDASKRTGLDMPSFIEPLPDRPDIPMGLEDPLADVLPSDQNRK